MQYVLKDISKKLAFNIKISIILMELLKKFGDFRKNIKGVIPNLPFVFFFKLKLWQI